MPEFPRQTDESLAAALAMCRGGDISGLSFLFAEYGNRVYRLSRSILGNDTDAEDATQEVFLRIFAKADKFDGRAAFTTWLYRLTVNHSLNWRRRLTRMMRGLAPGANQERLSESASHAPDFARQLEIKDEVDALLSRLSPEHRAVLALREISGLEYAEIAGVLAIPIGTVMSRLARARGELVRHVDPATESIRPTPVIR